MGDNEVEVFSFRRASDDWGRFLALGEGADGSHVPLEANEPAYILATSGTTAKPKLAVHTQGGYQVGIHAMGRVCFGMKPEDIWWSTSDIGWVVGHSYMVYAPLLFGCTTVAYEGALEHPDPTDPVAPRRGARRHGSLHLTYSRPAPHALRRGAGARLRPLLSRACRVRGGGTERARLGVAAEGGPRGSRSGDRPLVADGDRLSRDRQPVRARAGGDQAGLGRQGPPGHGGRRPHVRRRRGAERREGDFRLPRALPQPHPHALGRARALRERLLGEDPRRLVHGATRPTWTRRATSGSPDARTS
jgi:hypothetical protein